VPTDVHDELRDAVRGLVDRIGGVTTARRIMATDSGFDAGVWQRLTAELGLAGLAIDEDFGGQGATFVEQAVVVEELARIPFPVPVLGGILAAAATSDADVLGRIAAGEPAALCHEGTDVSAEQTPEGVVVSGRFDHVIDGQAAALFVVEVDQELYAVDAGDAEVRATPTLDQTRRQATVTVERAPGRRVIGDVGNAVDLGRVALAAECVGGARECLTMTVDYAKVRVQFGRPIGSFQALKHRIADMHVAVETAVSLAEHAAWLAVHDPNALPTVAAAAKAHCAEVYTTVAQETIQLHGGIGFTWEHDAHLHLKRAWSTRQLLGTPTALRRLVADSVGI
jgi:alkylation response protein AidB-like acyl-CoA dehydrogenase